MNQKPLFSGLDCLPGQQGLFQTDGAKLRPLHSVYGARGEWWIAVEPYEALGQMHDACGPYETKEAAEDDARGLRRTHGQ